MKLYLKAKHPWLTQTKPPRTRKRKKKKIVIITREEVDRGTREYFKKGGKITRIKPVQRAITSKSGVRPAFLNYDISTATDNFLMGR